MSAAAWHSPSGDGEHDARRERWLARMGSEARAQWRREEDEAMREREQREREERMAEEDRLARDDGGREGVDA